MGLRGIFRELRGAFIFPAGAGGSAKPRYSSRPSMSGTKCCPSRRICPLHTYLSFCRCKPFSTSQCPKSNLGTATPKPHRSETTHAYSAFQKMAVPLAAAPLSITLLIKTKQRPATRYAQLFANTIRSVFFHVQTANLNSPLFLVTLRYLIGQF